MFIASAPVVTFRLLVGFLCCKAFSVILPCLSMVFYNEVNVVILSVSTKFECALKLDHFCNRWRRWKDPVRDE